VSTKPRLEELAATVAREHQLVRGAASAMLEHAMSAGDALIEAEREVERGGFLSWLAVSLPHLSQSTATKYMCVARNRERVTESGAVSIREAMSLLREDGILGRPSLDLNVAVLDSVRAGEISERDAAKTLGVARSTVRRKLNPAVARKQSRDSARQRKQARRALRDCSPRAIRRFSSLTWRTSVERSAKNASSPPTSYSLVILRRERSSIGLAVLDQQVQHLLDRRLLRRLRLRETPIRPGPRCRRSPSASGP
jgi:hypothetical protein